MKKMYSKEQLVEIAGGEVDPSTLYGKFVRIIDASDIDSTALTDEQIELFKEGVFVNGNFLGEKNPLFMPASTVVNNIYFGICQLGAGFKIYAILANKSLYLSPNSFIGFNVVGTNSQNITINATNDLLLSANAFVRIYGKAFPKYPNDLTGKTYALKLVNGTLTWVEETA